MELKLQKQLLKEIDIDGHRFLVDVKDTSKQIRKRIFRGLSYFD